MFYVNLFPMSNICVLYHPELKVSFNFFIDSFVVNVWMVGKRQFSLWREETDNWMKFFLYSRAGAVRITIEPELNVYIQTMRSVFHKK